MNFERLLLNLAEIAVYIGFAGGMAELVDRAHRSGERIYIWFAAAYAAAIFLPASLILPAWGGWRYALWGIAIVWIIARYAFQPRLPKWLVVPQNLYRYCGAAMLLVALWSITAGEIQVILFTGLPALLASALIIYRTWAASR